MDIFEICRSTAPPFGIADLNVFEQDKYKIYQKHGSKSKWFDASLTVSPSFHTGKQRCDCGKPGVPACLTHTSPPHSVSTIAPPVQSKFTGACQHLHSPNELIKTVMQHYKSRYCYRFLLNSDKNSGLSNTKVGFYINNQFVVATTMHLCCTQLWGHKQCISLHIYMIRCTGWCKCDKCGYRGQTWAGTQPTFSGVCILHTQVHTS